MLRHTNSFFLSIFFHVLLAAILFYGYNYVSSPKKGEEKTIQIKLCCVAPQPLPKPKKPIEKKEIKPTPPKKEIKKIVPKKEKKIQKPKKKKIPLKKKVKKKQEPQIEKKVVPQKPPKPKEVQKPVETKTVEDAKPAKETKEEKNKRLSNEYLQKNLLLISKLLQENLYYPRSARKRGITGKVMVSFTISKSSKIHSIKVIESKSEILSRAAIKTINNLSEKFPVPKEDLTLNVPINYTLRK